MLPHVEPEPPNLAASVDKLLDDQGASPFISIKAVIILLRQQTGTKRSDADLEGLIVKKAKVRGVSVLFDREGR